MELNAVFAGFVFVCLSAQSLAAETFSCWYNSSGNLTGSETAQGTVGTINRTGKGDQASYLISALDGQACPMTLPGKAVRGLTAYLVQQDESNCTNDDVQATPSNVVGTVSVFYLSAGRGKAVVHLNDGSPATLYRFDLKCVQKLGNIKTDLDGKGNAPRSTS
jgi:hypothetical protein